MSTIAFFKLSDFIGEVRDIAWPRVKPVVHIEGLTRKVAGDPYPIIRYEVWITAQGRSDVLAARFLIGAAHEIFISQYSYLQTNNEKAEAILRRHLQIAGFDVRPGVIEHETTMEAHGDGLWHIDKETKELIEEIA
jgi:hypothetical protein